MATSTLRGIFPEPKPVSRRNFVRENIRQLKEMQGYIQDLKATSKSQEIKPDKYKHVAPRVYSTIMPKKKLSKGSVPNPPAPNQSTRNYRTFQPRKRFENKIIHRGVQTDKPEDVSKQHDTKHHSPIRKQPAPFSQKIHEQGDAPKSLVKNMQKLDLEDKQNYIKQNIKNIKSSRQKPEEQSDPTLAPITYQKGALPKYLAKEKKEKPEKQEGKEVIKSAHFEGDSLSGLVLLPDEERKEYLRVARENYAGLIKELNSMPVSNDTLKKRKRKMEIEEELKRLEEVIRIFQKPKVFVKADV